MKLQLNNSELLALGAVVQDVAEGWPNDTMHKRLLKAMMERLSYDLAVKRVLIKKKYILQWHPERAMAFYCAFESMPVSKDPYVTNLILRLMEDIRKAYTPTHIFSTFKYLIQ